MTKANYLIELRASFTAIWYLNITKATYSTIKPLTIDEGTENLTV